MNLKFEFECLGWIKCKLDSNDSELLMSHNNDYGDEFYTLLENVSIIIDTHLDSNWYGFERKAVWCDDSFDFEWLFICNENGINLVINKYVHDTNEFIERVYNVTLKAVNLAMIFYSALKGLYDVHGLLGFKASWEKSNFPIYQYLQFKSFILNKKLPVEYLYGEMGIMKSSKFLEIELLNLEL